jgi:hypothetical protein
MCRCIIRVLPFIFLFLIGCSSDPKTDQDTNQNTNPNTNTAATTKLTAIKFEELEHDFGKIKAGEVISHVFKFTNTGTEPLIIDNVKPSCGCTTPEWSKDPVPPGGTGFIKAVFDSKGREGSQSKTITVKSNTNPEFTELKFKVEVEK